MPLSDRHERFCQEYLVDLNATRAYQRAYPNASAETARRNGHNLLTNADVQSRVAELQAERAQRARVTVDDVVLELKRIAFLDPRRVMSWGPGGVRFTPSADLTEDEARCVQEASQTVTEGGGTIRVKLAGKVEALTLLGRHLGMWNDKLQVEGGAELRVVEKIVDGHPAPPEAT